MDENTYKDALEPLTSEPYKNIRDFKPSPFAKNRQAFITTAYAKGESYIRCLNMFEDMVNLKETFCIGADYKLPAKYKRGRTTEQVEALEEKVGTMFFNTNYRSRWLNTNDSCIVDIEKLKNLQVLPKPDLKQNNKNLNEIYISCDVARSQKQANNESAISVLKVKRDKKDKVKNIQVVNLIKLPNGSTFQTQALHIKRLMEFYNAQMLILDVNGLGIGLLDVLMEPQIDPVTGKEFSAYDTVNSEHYCSYKDSKPLIYAVTAQSNNTQMIVNFCNIVDNGILQLLEHVDANKVMEIEDIDDYMKNEILAHVRTQNFIDEVSNITVDTLSGGRLQIKQVVKANKDLFSSVQYGSYYIMSEKNEGIDDSEDIDYSMFFSFSAPRIR